MKVFTGNNPNVWKYVFDFDGAPAEAVLYRYPTFEERTVLCISTQSGCPVGCTFCGTGNRFIRNLTRDEIVFQVMEVLADQKIMYKSGNTFRIEKDISKKFQIMFMSMGEPFLNYDEVQKAIKMLNRLYPYADLLVSTMAPRVIRGMRHFIELSKDIDKIGLQFSIHKPIDSLRDKIIPYKNKLTLRHIRNYGIEWWKETGRKPYCNYCLDGQNHFGNNADALMNLFPPNVFCFTFSVLCSHDETMKDAGYRNLDVLRDFEERFKQEGYDTRIFDPAGQDDIGGGCGQLWYVQQKLKDYGKK